MAQQIYFLLVLLLVASGTNSWTIMSPARIPSSHSQSFIARELVMQARQSGGGGSTKIDNRTKQKIAEKISLKDEIEKDWRLILHDDTVHTIQEVCEIIGTCCPLCPPSKAYEVTLETHMTGAGTIAVANKKIINEYTKTLQVAGLTVSCAPDDDFEGGDFDDGE
jgi:ATP-dependent Clp protease adapter protein ClpS